MEVSGIQNVLQAMSNGWEGTVNYSFMWYFTHLILASTFFIVGSIGTAISATKLIKNSVGTHAEFWFMLLAICSISTALATIAIPSLVTGALNPDGAAIKYLLNVMGT